MADEVQMTSQFPLSGVDVSCEFERQPPLTSADAANCRAYDTIQERGRGGSRSGLSKLIDATVNGVHVIQHLTLLVDPTLPGLNADNDVDGDFPDPSTNNLRQRNFGRVLRQGGSGRQPNRNGPTSSSNVITYQQFVGPNDSNPVSVANVTGSFPAPPASGDYIVAFAATYAIRGAAPPDQGIVSAVTNGSSSPYQMVGTYGRGYYQPPNPNQNSDKAAAVSVWVKRASGPADQTVVLSRSGPSAGLLTCVCYRGVHVSGPFFSAVTNAASSVDPITVLTAGNIPCSVPGSALLGVLLAAPYADQVILVSNGFVDPATGTPGAINTFGQLLNQGSPVELVGTDAGGSPIHLYVAAGIGLRKKSS